MLGRLVKKLCALKTPVRQLEYMVTFPSIKINSYIFQYYVILYQKSVKKNSCSVISSLHADAARHVICIPVVVSLD